MGGEWEVAGKLAGGGLCETVCKPGPGKSEARPRGKGKEFGAEDSHLEGQCE